MNGVSFGGGGVRATRSGAGNGTGGSTGAANTLAAVSIGNVGSSGMDGKGI